MTGRRYVWAVSRGSYSEYRVLGLFPTKPLAEKVASDLNGTKGSWDDARVEPFTFWSEDDMPGPVTYWCLNQVWWDDGSTGELIEVQMEDHEITADPSEIQDRPYIRWIRAPIHNNKGGRIEIRGRDRDACYKVLTDQRSQYLVQPFRMREFIKSPLEDAL